MKKFNRTYVMGILGLALAAWITWQTTMIPERMVSNEPGPKFFPFISAAGIALFSILSMIFDGPKDNNAKAYLDKQGWVRMALIMVECLVYCLAMDFIGFWIASILGLFAFVWTLRGDKKINLVFAVCFCIVLASICYFGFTRGFHIPLPSGSLWNTLGIPMP